MPLSSHESPATNIKITQGPGRNRPRPLPRPPIVQRPRPRLSRSLPPRPLPVPPVMSKSPRLTPISLPTLPTNPLSFELLPPKHIQNLPSTSNHMRHRHPSILLTLDTSSDALSSSRWSETKETSSTSSISPFILQVPTPRTARRRRISKLQRYLGETIPEELIPLSPVPMYLLRDHEREQSPFDPLTLWKKEQSRSPAAISSRHKSFEKKHTSVLPEGGPNSEVLLDDEELWDPRAMLYGNPRYSSRTYDRLWQWERAGVRWKEENLTDVVQALRSL